jgi:hypothetical protein
MSKIICIGDIHNRWVQAQTIIDKYNDTHKIILMGDYFDNFYDTAIDADQVARWLKKTLENPNIIALMGNHDINYDYRNVRDSGQIYNCSGYSPAKDDAINRIMTNEDWDKIKIAHFENGFWFSHAGFHPFWFGNPVTGMTNESIEKKLNKIYQDIQDRTFSNELCGAGRCRGGPHRVGGLLWRDQMQETYCGEYWNDNSGIKQVCGHTPMRKGIDVEETRNKGLCIDVDCGLKQVLEILEDGTYNIIDTGLDNFYQESEKKFQEEQKALKKQQWSSLGAYDSIYNSLNKS